MNNLKYCLLPIAVVAAPLDAQDKTEPTEYDRALAAGYKAQFICSGLWNGGKKLAAIEADELTGIYPRIAEIVPSLNAKIDQGTKRVSVSYDDDAPPRTAIWNPATGCTSMPIYWKPKPEPGNDTITLIGMKSTLYDRKAAGSMDELAWPNGDVHPIARPSQKTSAIRKLTQQAFDSETFGTGSKTSAVIIIRKGAITAEQYMQGHDLHTGQRTWSVAKSIAGTFAGYVEQQGFDIDSVLTDFWRSPSDPRLAIKMDDLLRMSSGLYSDTAGNRTDPIYMGGANVEERAVQWPLLRHPGLTFRYSNNDILLATLKMREAANDIHPHMMFDKIGMTRTFAETDWQGNYILSSQVWTTARDLARLGLLYLNDGVWTDADGKQERILPETWRTYVSAPMGPQPDGPFGYGATFWLMNKSDGIPKDAFAGFGNRGQYLVIIPSMDLVIVRRGYDTSANRFDIEEFTREIISAIN